jgi:hypothetical protein
MSVFQVNLNNVEQGLLDKHPTTGVQNAISSQRNVYVMGPNHINRLLSDGEQFTDCNYWKRFAYPQVSLAEAIVNVITDDGSVYSDVESENTYPKVYDITATAGTTYAANQADILGDTSGHAVFAQITNTTASGSLKVKLNGIADGIFDLGFGETQVFNSGDLSISMIEIDNSTSGNPTSTVQIIVSVRSICNS